MNVQQIYIIASLLLSCNILSAQESGSFEMSSPSYGIATSVITNTGGAVANNEYFLQHQFGAPNVGRMESATYKIGTHVKGSEDTMPDMPGSFALLQNYPNPFNQQTIFRYSLPRDSELTIAVLSVLGREIDTLYKGSQTAGEFELPYRGIDKNGIALPSGIYFCRIITKGFDKTIKFAILR
jgi:hypothetical protein